MKYPKTNLIPPKKGPNPQGLLIDYNTVKPVKLEKMNGGHRQGFTKRRSRVKDSIT